MKKRELYYMTGMLLFTALLNALSWILPSFSDFYTDHIFLLFTGSLGRLTSLVPFSVGERMIAAGVLLLLVLAVLLLLYPFVHRQNFRRRARGFFRFMAHLVIVVALVMTLNCFLLYHCTPLSPGGSGTERRYTVKELACLRDYIVEEASDFCGSLPHSDDVLLLAPEDLTARAMTAVKSLSAEYPRFSSYCVTPKPLSCSGFISQQHMQGYYFPFSMEANYNTIMQVGSRPFTLCHELAHTHGYIYEDEANYLGFLACIKSGDPFLVYSGYLGVLNYVDNAFYRSVSREEYRRHVRVPDQVRLDNRFLTDEDWLLVEEASPLDTEKVHQAANTFVDTTLKVNGVQDGYASYDRVVELLLRHYIGTGLLPCEPEQ